MNFLEHGDIRKSGRAILIACTIFVLLNECSETFEKIVLFGFEVRITHEMLLGFLRVGIWVLCGIFIIRFVQDYAAWAHVFSGKKATEARQSVLVNFADNRLTEKNTRADAIRIVNTRFVSIGDPRYAAYATKLNLVNSEYSRFYFKRAGDLIDTIALQIVLPSAAVIYAFLVSPTLTLVCEAV